MYSKNSEILINGILGDLNFMVRVSKVFFSVSSFLLHALLLLTLFTSVFIEPLKSRTILSFLPLQLQMKPFSIPFKILEPYIFSLPVNQQITHKTLFFS